MKIGILIQKTIIEPKNRHFDYKYFYWNLVFDNSIVNFIKVKS